jgi:tRNA (guanine37-N1)-methyltransferase
LNLKEAISGKLSKAELDKIKTAFDVVGDIAILEIDEPKYEKILADAVLAMQKNIKVVVRKEGIHEGEFRVQKYKVIAGEKRTVTVHKENNCSFKLDIQEAYFSPRLATERKRIAELIKKQESVLVMFSGVGPYPIIIAKNTPALEVYGIEKNPKGHEYALINNKLNKTNVNFICADVRDAKLKIKFDRIAMPLPRGGEDFLDVAIDYIKDGGVIHFYDFLHENDLADARNKVAKACKRNKVRFRTLNFRRCGQSGPRFFRVVLDFRCWKK